MREHVADQLRADQAGQEVVPDDPLVVPGQCPLGRIEQAILRRTVGPEPVDEPVVGVQQRQVQVSDEDVDVVARVADQGYALAVAGQVEPSMPGSSFAGSPTSYRYGAPTGPSP